MLRTINAHWREFFEGLGLGISLLILVFAKQQLDLANKQLEVEQLREPHLAYSSQLVLSPTDQQVAFDATKQLIESFFAQVYQYTRNRPDATYLEAIDSLLPLTATLPARSLVAVTIISNNGQTTVTKVRAFLTTDRPITSFDVRSLEPYTRLKGGVGENELTIELDRIVAGNAVTITLASQIAESNKQLDQIVLQSTYRLLDKPKLGLFTDYFYPKDSPFAFAPSTYFLPVARYIPGQLPTVNVVVTSEQVQGHLLPTATPLR